MKRLTIYFVLVAFICSGGFAEKKSVEKSYRRIGGGAWLMEDGIAGGFGEIGFNLGNENKGNVIRNIFIFEGIGANLQGNRNLSFGAMNIGNKFLFGQVYNCNNDLKIRAYGVLGESAGIFKAENHQVIKDLTFLGNVFFGGGFEIQFTSEMAFFTEFGGNCRFVFGKQAKSYSEFTNSSPTLTIGYRSLF